MKNDGGPAFPAPGKDSWGDRITVTGMSLRDYFAAKAMNALISTSKYEVGLDYVYTASDRPTSNLGKTAAYLIAKNSYIMADSMLAEREK